MCIRDRGKFFWGFFFIYLNFNLSINAHTLNVLPEFVGYFLLLQGLRELEEESGVFSDTRPFVVGMTVYTAILWVEMCIRDREYAMRRGLEIVDLPIPGA